MVDNHNMGKQGDIEHKKLLQEMKGLLPDSDLLYEPAEILN